jgi:hypothetical protein
MALTPDLVGKTEAINDGARQSTNRLLQVRVSPLWPFRHRGLEQRIQGFQNLSRDVYAWSYTEDGWTYKGQCYSVFVWAEGTGNSRSSA